jgi:hypothetical protein
MEQAKQYDESSWAIDEFDVHTFHSPLGDVLAKRPAIRWTPY